MSQKWKLNFVIKALIVICAYRFWMCKTALPANRVHILFFLYYMGSTYQQTVFSNYFLVDYSLEIKTSQTEALTLFIPRTIHFIMHVFFSGRTDNRITEHEIMLGRVATSQEPVSLFFFYTRQCLYGWGNDVCSPLCQSNNFLLERCNFIFIFKPLSRVHSICFQQG